ncbi:MAG: hypothetical protein ACOC22_04275 [bacterium]
MGKFRDFLKEMPHVIVKGKPFDFHLEKKEWVNELIDEIKKLNDRDQKKLFSPLFKLKYMEIFSKKVKELNDKDRKKLFDVLPKYVKERL